MSVNRLGALVFVMACALSCARDKPSPDSASPNAKAGLPAPDTIKSAPVAASDSAKMRAQADTKGASSPGRAVTIPSKAPAAGAKTPSQGRIIGRDSVSPKPKVLGLPVVADTAKRRPPR